MPTINLDLKGLNCPLPVLRANKKIKSLDAGDVLSVEVTDPAAPKDFETYCNTTGHSHIGCTEVDGVYTISIQKSG